ncbi:reverse transcriptase domain-containing protein [Tanacetum coccineum]
MRTRSQSRRRRQQQTLPVVENFDLEDPIVEQNVVPMADNRTMAQMLQAPIEGYEDAIVVPPINANNFELKQPLINLVQSNKFTGRQDPHNHLRFFNKVTSTFRHPEVPNTSVKLLLFPFSLDGEARDWLDKEPPRSILTWDDLVSKFINQYFPPSKTTYYRNEIITFYQKPNEAFNEAWERFKGLLRQCPHHGFSELHQLDTFYNSLNSNDQDALDSAAGGNFLDKMPQEGLAIIESKSKVRYSRSRANDSRVSTDAPLSNSSPSNNSFDMQQIAASLEDKMTIKMNQMMNQMKALVVTTPAPVKAVEEVCVTCGSNHNFTHCPLTRSGNDFPVFHDNIQQFQQTAAVAEILKKFNYTDVKSASTLVDLKKPLVKDGDADDVDVYLYRSMIESLMYLITSRPDIIYLKGKPTLGLWYSRDSPFELVAYTDSDYAGATQDRKSTTRDLLTKGFDAGRHVKRGRDTKIPQSIGPHVKVGDKAIHKELGDRMERAATTTSSLKAEQDSEKPAESDRFHEIIDFLNAKANTVNSERQLQALVDKKRVIIMESSIRSDLHLAGAGGIDCLPTTTIFEELTHIGAKSTPWNEFSSTMASTIIYFATNQKFNLSKYIYDVMKERIGFFEWLNTHVLQTMMVQATQDEGVDSGILTDSQHTPITTQSLSFRPQKKQSRRKQRKDTKVPQDERIMMTVFLYLPMIHYSVISGLKKRVQKLERKNKSRTIGLQRLRKVGESSRVESSEDTESLGAQEDASKQGRIKIVDETQGRLNDAEMFDIDDLHDDEVIVDMAIGEKQEKSVKIDEKEVSTGIEDSDAPTILVTTADKGVTAAKIDEITPTSAPTTVIDELTLAQTLIEIKAPKPKVVTTIATITTTRPKAKGVVVQEPSEFRTTTSSPQASQPSKIKDKGKAIMIEPEVPLKRKDQVALDEEIARNLEAQLEAKLIEEGKMARKKEEEANIALIKSWENTQAMMEADRLLAERLQTREQEELTDEEKENIFMEFMERRRKHFAALRAQEKRNRPPTKAQNRNQISVYLKHMGGYKHNQLKGRIYDEIQKLFDKEMKRVNSFVAMNSEAQEIRDKLESDESKKQKTDENEEVEEDNEAELKMHMVIVKDDDIAVDAIPLATKPPVIGIDREDLETLWKLVKTKHGDTRPEDEHERVLWGDLKVMFEPDIKSDVWRNLQGYKVTIWKLYDSCGVHFVSADNAIVFLMEYVIVADKSFLQMSSFLAPELTLLASASQVDSIFTASITFNYDFPGRVEERSLSGIHGRMV